PPLPLSGCARSGDIAMSGGATTLIMTSCVCDAVMPATLIVNLPEPSIAVGPALTVTVVVPPAVLADVGMNEATTPAGSPVAVKLAVSALPVVLVSVTVAVAMPPTGTSSAVVGESATLKSLTEYIEFD